MPETFNGLSGSFAEDIAIVELQNKVTISHVVAPVCMHWGASDLYNITDGTFGQVNDYVF